jgi:hypothetical protein
MTIHNSRHVRAEADFYPTLDAPDVIRVLLESVTLPGAVWEPHAGAGHLVKALRAQGVEVLASDLHAYPLVPGLDVQIRTGVDFLTQTDLPYRVRSIVMNPPYGRGIDAHIHHALALLRHVDGVLVLLARSDLSYAGGRKVLMRDPGFARKVELGWRLRWVEGTKESGKHNYALYIWDYREGRSTGATIGHGYRLERGR